LPDRSMLGRKGRCGKCSHKFILTEPAPPVFAEAPPPQGKMPFEYADDLPDPGADKTMMGISVRYVPDESSPQNPTSAGLRGAAPPPPAAPAVEQFSLPEMLPDPLAGDDSDSHSSPVAKVRQKRQQARRRQMVFGGVAVALVAIAAGAFWAISQNQPKKLLTKDSNSRSSKSKSDAGEDAADEASKSGGKGQEKPGDPVTLALVPEGARILIHLRPADLWQSGSAEEVRACLGPLGEWLEKTITARCLMPPAEVEEALFALIPISRDTFDTAVVVRSKKDLKRSELIEKFDGELVDKPREHYVGKERAWLVFDNRTFASAPKSMAQSLAESADSPSVTSDGIQAVLSMTDRKRHFAIVCDLEDVRLGVNTLAPESARKLLEGVVDFFGDDVESLAWCLNLGDAEGANDLRSEVFVRNKLSRSPPKLLTDLKQKLAKLPAEMLELVYMTHPKKIGEKKVVGRFPIMTKVVERKTKFDTAHRLVSMKVDLPERAGPNLALGTLLTWNQTTLPGFGTSSKTDAPVMAAKSNLPDKIADRLKKKITVDFRREFMYKAIEFISEETGVQFKLDGPGLKEVGLTQNIYQTFTMENVPATAVLYKIVVEGSMDKGKPQLVLIVD
ncbi:MAG TPA: hypothetical protein VGH74_21710, partial [Planctomycetaceae bacterium]